MQRSETSGFASSYNRQPNLTGSLVSPLELEFLLHIVTWLFLVEDLPGWAQVEPSQFSEECSEYKFGWRTLEAPSGSNIQLLR